MRVQADQTAVGKLTEQLAAMIDLDVSRFRKAGPWALIGLRSRGDVLARRLAAILKPDHIGTLDFTLYRDDLHAAAAQPMVQATEVSFAVDGIHVVLVDDVLMTGRSVRAALQSLMDLGRPSRVWLAVLVDRGGRELPIAADYVALDLTGSVDRPRRAAATGPALPAAETVEVHLQPTDADDAIIVRGASESPLREGRPH